MTISQRDARSVRVEHDGHVFSLAYRFWWEGRDRPPESITVDGARVTAFFLSASIRDTVTVDAHGVLVRREWSVRSTGPVRLTVDVHLETTGPVSYLLPGVALSTGLPAEGVSLHGARTAWPSAACLAIGGRGTVGFALDEGPFTAGISVSPVGQDEVPPAERDEGPVPLSLALTVPGTTGIADAPDAGSVESPGTLDAARTFRIVSAPARRAWLRGASAVLAAVGGGASPAGKKSAVKEPSARVKEEAVRGSVIRAVEGCLETHLYAKGGVAGLRVEPASPLLSASAGAGMAVLLRELFPSDPVRTELALRLADFSLKGQHPSGLFYETYHVGRGEWQGVPGQPDRPVIGIAASARIADRLLAFADALCDAGLPFAEYRLAGVRFVEFFLDEQGRFQLPGALHLPGVRVPFEPGLAGFELCFPLARILSHAGHDRYRKALDALAHALGGLPWGTPWLPTSREGRDPDSAAALLCGRLLIALAGSGRSSRGSAGARKGRGPVDVGDAATVVLPWVYANPRPPVGGDRRHGRHRRLVPPAALRGRRSRSRVRPGGTRGHRSRALDAPDPRRFFTAVPRLRGPAAHGNRLARPRRSGAAAGGRREAGQGVPPAPRHGHGPDRRARLVAEAGYRLALAAGPGRAPHLV